MVSGLVAFTLSAGVAEGGGVAADPGGHLRGFALQGLDGPGGGPVFGIESPGSKYH